MKLDIVRPDSSFSKEEREKLRVYLCDHWKRVQQSRTEQLGRYKAWNKNYLAIPAEEVRNVPWYKSSNFVVPLIRIFVDTFVARTLNTVFATRPVFAVDGFDNNVKEALEYYLNQKALHEWETYYLFRDMLTRGNKNGTAVIKSIWSEERELAVTSLGGSRQDEDIVVYAGPRNEIIPFEDFAIYPVTANYMRHAVIKFHQIRMVEEVAKQRWKAEAWELSESDLDSMLVMPTDLTNDKRTEQQQDSGVYDPYLKELHGVECYLKWTMGGQDYRIVALIEPTQEKLIDVYFYPYPRNWEIFQDYRPFPQEDFFYGESMASILQQAQEETSQIHNDRRNNSYLANAPVFRRRNGSLIPNPSTNWYPGKVFDLESLEDLDIMQIGRNYSDTLGEENWDLQLSERLSGIGAVMQGYAAGMMGKRGIYNSSGTLALMQESNQRQDTNIRDARQVLGAVGKTNIMLQSTYGADDAFIETLPTGLREQVHQALTMCTPDRVRYARLSVKASDAGTNKEINRQNLIQLAQTLNSYAGAVQQMAMQLANPQLAPGLRALMNDTIKMMKWLATRMLRAYDEYDAEGVLPDATAAVELLIPGGSRGTKEAGNGALPGGPVTGSNGQPNPPLSREGLETLLTLPGANGGGA